MARPLPAFSSLGMLVGMQLPKQLVKIHRRWVKFLDVRGGRKCPCKRSELGFRSRHRGVELPFRHPKRFISRNFRLPTVPNKPIAVVEPAAALGNQRLDLRADVLVGVRAGLPRPRLAGLTAIRHHAAR